MSEVRAEDSLILINGSAVEVTVDAKFLETNVDGDLVNIVAQSGVVYDMVDWDVIDSNKFTVVEGVDYIEGAAPVVPSDNRPGELS